MQKKSNGRKFYIMTKFHSIRTAIMVYYVLLAVIALSIFAMVATYYTRKHVLRNSEEYGSELVDQVNKDIDSYIEYLDNISLMFASDEDVQSYLFDAGGQGRERFSRIVTVFGTILESRHDIVNIGIFGQDGRHIINYGLSELNPNADIEQFDWVKQTYRHKGMANISSSHVQNIVYGRYKWVITLSRTLRNPQTKQAEGIFFADLNYSSIRKLCEEIDLGSKGYIYILDADGKIIYHPQQQLLYSGLQQELTDEVLAYEGRSFVTEDKERLYSVSKSQKTGWFVVGVSYVEDLLEDNLVMNRMYVLSAFGIMGIAMVLAFYLSSQITKPMKRLTESMKEIEKGNFDNAMLEVNGDSEIDRLSANFNIMTRQIKLLMDQNIEEQEEKRKSELRALQAQINPHFLYNTLDSIIWMAEWGKNKEVVTMTSALAKLLRQSISNQNELVTVREEIEYARSYLIIQKMRYKDKLEYEIRVEPEILEAEMPKLIVQPLVENAIYHGIKYKEGKGRVLVEGIAGKKEFVLKIVDDGVGMTAEQLESIFEKREIDRKRNGVGVLNVQKRIQLYYGKEYGLTFHSGLGEGTAVEIHIPYERGEKNVGSET